MLTVSQAGPTGRAEVSLPVSYRVTLDNSRTAVLESHRGDDLPFHGRHLTGDGRPQTLCGSVTMLGFVLLPRRSKAYLGSTSYLRVAYEA